MKNAEQPINPTTSWSGCENISHLGLIKREYFSILIMQSLLSGRQNVISRYKAEDVVKISLEYADELLKQLEK